MVFYYSIDFSCYSVNFFVFLTLYVVFRLMGSISKFINDISKTKAVSFYTYAFFVLLSFTDTYER